MDKETVLQNVSDFLDECYTSDRGWVKPSDDDLDQLFCIIRSIIDLKFDKDCDGDPPVDCFILDRTKYEIPCWFPISKVNVDSSKDDVLKALSEASVNLQTSANIVNRLVSHPSAKRKD